MLILFKYNIRYTITLINSDVLPLLFFNLILF